MTQHRLAYLTWCNAPKTQDTNLGARLSSTPSPSASMGRRSRSNMACCQLQAAGGTSGSPLGLPGGPARPEMTHRSGCQGYDCVSRNAVCAGLSVCNHKAAQSCTCRQQNFRLCHASCTARGASQAQNDSSRNAVCAGLSVCKHELCFTAAQPCVELYAEHCTGNIHCNSCCRSRLSASKL